MFEVIFDGIRTPLTPLLEQGLRAAWPASRSEPRCAGTRRRASHLRAAFEFRRSKAALFHRRLSCVSDEGIRARSGRGAAQLPQSAYTRLSLAQL